MAYVNQDNTFTETNTFEWNTIFKWQISTQYNEMTADTFNIDANLWLKAAVTWSTDHAMSFTNLTPWTTITFVIVPSVSVNLTFWTASWFNNLWAAVSYDLYWIWGDTYPKTLANTWVHLFVAEVYTTAIHIWYAWISSGL